MKLFQQLLLAFLCCSCDQTQKDRPALKAQGTAIISPTTSTNDPGNTQHATRNTAHALHPSIAGYVDITFDKLSGFPASVTYEVVNSNTPSFYYAPKLAGEIPEDIKTLNGKDVAIQGFMLPLKGDNGRVQEFILLKNQLYCCFGRPPKVNEWIHVRVKGDGLKPIMDQVVTIYGTFQVGEYSENRQMLGIYRLQGDGMAMPAQF